MTAMSRTIDELADRPVADVVTARGRELQLHDTVADLRVLFASASVRLVPVLEGDAYVGAVCREDVPEDAAGSEPITAYIDRAAPTVRGSQPLAEAVGILEELGGRRLVVLADDGVTYRGLLCLRSDRRHLCLDAECHAAGAATVDPSRRVADLVLEDPTRARVLEGLGIDYCCGGRISLADACAARGHDAADVAALLGESRTPGSEDVDWTTRPAAELARHIVETHHAYLRDELGPLGELVEKVARRHGDAHPELLEVRDRFATLAVELAQHLPKEELVVFPAASRPGADDGEGIAQAIREMEGEHDAVAELLVSLRELTHGYVPPAAACMSYRAMLARLAELEVDTHRHVHEENNILFPAILAGTA